jgi:hypothetical protein
MAGISVWNTAKRVAMALPLPLGSEPEDFFDADLTGVIDF